jgi:hypothetical protein
LTPIEPDETERAGELWMVSLERVEHAKSLHRVDDFFDYAPVSVIDKQEALHGFSLSSRAVFLNARTACVQ